MMASRVAVVALVVAGLVVGASGGASGRPLPAAPNCAIFPSDNPWNQRVDRLPLAKRSARIVASIGSGAPVHADFGSGTYNGRPIGIPFTTVSGSQKKVPISFEVSRESDRGPYPIPANAPIEGGRSSDGDRHVIVVDRDHCRLYELYSAYPRAGGTRWSAYSGATWSLRSNHVRPKTWTSGDAAGLPILPGLARYDEVKKGRIDHALRFTAPYTRRAFIYPARHYASSSTDPNLPAMGQRIRLKRTVSVRGFPRQAQIVMLALRRYGMILADNGSSMYISGAPSSRWNNDVLHELARLHGRDFEVVDTSKLPRPSGG
jgi:hypothetical protein